METKNHHDGAGFGFRRRGEGCGSSGPERPKMEPVDLSAEIADHLDSLERSNKVHSGLEWAVLQKLEGSEWGEFRDLGSGHLYRLEPGFIRRDSPEELLIEVEDRNGEVHEEASRVTFKMELIERHREGQVFYRWCNQDLSVSWDAEHEPTNRNGRLESDLTSGEIALIEELVLGLEPVQYGPKQRN
jgi:hypothetical protein